MVKAIVLQVNKMKTRNILELGGSTSVLVAALLSLLAWYHNSSAVPLRDLSKIHAYIPKSKVLLLLGEPDERESVLHAPGSWPNEESHRRHFEVDSQWWYRPRFKRYSLRVDFASDETVIRCVHQDLKKQREEWEKYLHDREIVSINLSPDVVPEVLTRESEAQADLNTGQQED